MQIICEEDICESHEENEWGDGIPLYEIKMNRMNSDDNFDLVLNNKFDFVTG